MVNRTTELTGPMPRYFFDYRHDGNLARDEVGTSMDSLEEAKVEALEALAELAGELPGLLRHQLSIEVRDADVPLLNVVMTINVKQFV